jgi:hypothetical protein
MSQNTLAGASCVSARVFTFTAMENTDYLEVTPRSQVPVSAPRSATGWHTSGKQAQ